MELDGSIEIQRYLTLEKFVDLIRNQHLFLSSVNSFEDHFEGKPTEMESIFEGPIPEMLNNIMNNTFVRGFGVGLSEENRSKLEKEDVEFKNSPKLFETVHGEIEFPSEISYENMIERQNNLIFANCWHHEKSTNENMAMWKIYGNHQDCVMITSSVERLRSSLTIPESYKSHIGKVVYVEPSEYDISNATPFRHILKKRNAYSFENEIRLLAYNSEKNSFEKALFSDNYDKLESFLHIELNPKTLVQDVITSPNCSPLFFKIIEGLTQDYLKSGSVLKRSKYDRPLN